MRGLKIRCASAVLVVLAVLSVVGQVRALQTLSVERPDLDARIDRLLCSNNGGSGSAGISLCANARKYAVANSGDPPFYGDYLGFNVSTIVNSREGIDYSWENMSITSVHSPSWMWDGTATDLNTEQSYNETSFANGGIWVDLPVDRSFIFYGEKYMNWSGIPCASHVWICKNGFVCLDDSNSTSVGPTAFPSADPPNAVIAPFWTSLDFIAGQSEIDTWVSRELNMGYWFVVKWLNMRETGTSNLCTFGLSFRIYSRTIANFDSYPSDRVHLASGDIWFFYNGLKASASSFTYGLEDQTGYKSTYPYGGTLAGSWATQFNGSTMHYWNALVPYVKYVMLTFKDSNSNGAYWIDESNTYGSGLYYNSTAVQQPDTRNTYIDAATGALDYAVNIGDAAVTVGQLLVESTALGTLATVLGPAGIFLFAAEKLYDWYTSHQYSNLSATYQYNRDFRQPQTLPGGRAYVNAPAFDNYTGQTDTVFDACLETEFCLVCYNDYHVNHTLTITATAECGYWGGWVPPDYNVSTSVSLNLFPDNNNDVSHAQQVGYGFYGDNPMLYVGECPDSYDHDDVYNITLQQNFGTEVEVCPPLGLDIFLNVTDPQGGLVGFSNNGANHVEENVTFVPSCTGNYTIDVHGLTGGGFYNMTIFHPPILTISPCGGGTTNPAPGNHTYYYGRDVTVTAMPSSGWNFYRWSLDGTYYDDNPITVTMTTNHTLHAFFQSSGESCPFVSTWNGTCYVLDNNILPQSETSNGADVTDYYTLEQTSVPRNGTYPLLISEFEHEHTYLDSAELIAVDHRAGVNVGVSPSGQILTYTHPYPAVWATTNEGENVKNLLDAVDGNYYQGYNGSFVTLDFGRLDVSWGAKLVIVSDMIIIKCPINIQTRDAHGAWQTVATIYTRNHWATDVIDLKQYLPDCRGRLMVRLCFVHNDTVDFVGLDTSPQARMDVHPGQLVSAVSSTDGDVTANLLYTDNSYAELVPGENIQLAFNLPRQTMQTRTYIIMTEGHYYTITP